MTLGALTVLSRRDVWINSAHVVCGALVLTTSLVLTLRAWRVTFSGAGCDGRPLATDQPRADDDGIGDDPSILRPSDGA